MNASDLAELDADIERMLTVRRNRRELGWSYWGLAEGGGHLIGRRSLTTAERQRRYRAGEAKPRRPKAAA